MSTKTRAPDPERKERIMARTSRTRYLALALALGATLAVPAGPALAEQDKGKATQAKTVRWSAECVGASVGVTGSREALEPFVGDGFTLVAEPGTGSVPLIVQIFRCAPWAPDGEHPLITSTLVVNEILAPAMRDDGAVVLYGIQALGDSNDLQAAYAPLGLPYGLGRDLRYTESGGPVPTAEGIVPRHGSPHAVSGYSLKVRTSGNPTTDLNQGSTCAAWQVGKHGPVCFSYVLHGATLDWGVGEVHAEPDSIMERIIGTGTAAGPATLRSFRVEVTAQLFPPTTDSPDAHQQRRQS